MNGEMVMRFQLPCLVALVLAVSPVKAAAKSPDPLCLVPGTVDAVVKLESPRALYDAIYGHEAFQEFLKIDAVAAFYDTVNYRRALQVIAYLEKELGHKRLDLLERLTGGGMVASAQFEQKAVLVIVQAKDE